MTAPSHRGLLPFLPFFLFLPLLVGNGTLAHGQTKILLGRPGLYTDAVIPPLPHPLARAVGQTMTIHHSVAPEPVPPWSAPLKNSRSAGSTPPPLPPPRPRPRLPVLAESDRVLSVPQVTPLKRAGWGLVSPSPSPFPRERPDRQGGLPPLPPPRPRLPVLAESDRVLSVPQVTPLKRAGWGLVSPSPSPSPFPRERPDRQGGLPPLPPPRPRLPVLVVERKPVLSAPKVTQTIRPPVPRPVQRPYPVTESPAPPGKIRRYFSKGFLPGPIPPWVSPREKWPMVPATPSNSPRFSPIPMPSWRVSLKSRHPKAASFVSRYDQLASRGDAGAQVVLGTLLLYDEESFYDPDKAFHWFFQAAQEGDRLAQFNLGLLYQKGMGTEKDGREARYWFLQAIAEDDERSWVGMTESLQAWIHIKLGLLHYEGEMLPIDYQEARYWFEKAARNHHAYGQYMMGLLYLEGQGVEKNTRQALSWLKAAAAQGLEVAQERLDQERLDQKRLKRQTP